MVKGKYPIFQINHLNIELQEKQQHEAENKKSGKIDYDKIERDEAQEKVRMEEDMLSMVSGMKNFAKGFQEKFKEDESVIKDVGELQSANIEKTDVEIEKINH